MGALGKYSDLCYDKQKDALYVKQGADKDVLIGALNMNLGQVTPKVLSDNPKLADAMDKAGVCSVQDEKDAAILPITNLKQRGINFEDDTKAAPAKKPKQVAPKVGP